MRQPLPSAHTYIHAHTRTAWHDTAQRCTAHHRTAPHLQYCTAPALPHPHRRARHGTARARHRTVLRHAHTSRHRARHRTAPHGTALHGHTARHGRTASTGHKHARTNKHTHTRTHARTHACTHARAYTKQTQTHTRAHIHTYTHLHTYTRAYQVHTMIRSETGSAGDALGATALYSSSQGNDLLKVCVSACVVSRMHYTCTL